MDVITRLRFPYSLTNFIKYLVRSPSSFQNTQRVLFHCSVILNVKGEPIKMPSLSPTMEEGKIIKWLKKEGDTINPGDAICDIETDKAVLAMEIDEQGILAKILVPENGPNVKVGSLIALMVGEGEDWKNVELPEDIETSTSIKDSTDTAKSSSAQDSSVSDKTKEEELLSKPTIEGPPSMPIKMPSLSPTMTSGTIITWLKKEGDSISPGDVLCEIQTDKAVMSMETEEEGILAKIILGNDSKDVKVGTVIALMVDSGADWKSVSNIQINTQKQTENKSTITSSLISTSSDLKSKVFGPAVKSLLDIYQIEAGLVKPTGRNNRILKEDVIKYVENNKLEKKPPKIVALVKSDFKTSKSPSILQQQQEKPAKKAKSQSHLSPTYKDIEVSNMRQVIAKRLSQSKQTIPHSYAVVKCLVDKLMDARKTLKESTPVSLNDLVIKATALALQIYPKANALVVNDVVKLSNTVDISIAVATDAGLFTPIVKSTNSKNVIAISKEVKDLAAKAKAGKLKPEEFQGGTFTISNLGMFGITHFKAIINPPQSCILAVGGTIEGLDPDLKPKKEMVLSLSYDRRSMEEWEAAEFMETLKYVIENPKLILRDVETTSILGL